METDRAQKIVLFDSFEVDLRSGELRNRGIKIKLRAQSFDVLAMLLEHPLELVGRGELRARLWPGDVFVDFENNLNTAVARLREALGDSADRPRFIETLPRRGYRFIRPVATREAIPGKLDSERIRLVVLPFDNLSDDHGQSYFSDGLTEELITELACIAPRHLTVIARTSAMCYRDSHKSVAQIGHELDVDYVVEGSVRRADDRVRISAQLVKLKDQTHIWAKSYDGELRCTLNLQRDVAQAIVRHIDAELLQSAAPRVSSYQPVHPEAHDAYLLALHHFNQASPSGFQQADRYLRRAIEIDSGFALAYAKQAMGHALSAFFGYAPHSEAFPKAEVEARNAIKIENSLTEAHSALALVHWFHHWDLHACESELEFALDLNPNDPTAHWTSAMFLGSMKEEHERAANEASLALRLDPLSIAIRSMTCWLPYWARHYDEAIAQAHATLELDGNALQAYYVLGTAARAKGALDDAIATLEQATRKFGDPFSLAYLGMTYGHAGKRNQARAVLDQLEQKFGPQFVPPVFCAFVYAGLGECARAIEHLEKAFEIHDALVLWLRVSPDWDVLRSEPRFQDLLRKLNSRLPPVSLRAIP